MLFYLNTKFDKNEVTSIRELSELLEISRRQVRRYRDDLEQAGFFINSKAGTNGGYILLKPLDWSLAIPENLLLSLNVAMKNNVSLLDALNKLPVVSNKLTSKVYGDYSISNEALEKEAFIVDMIQKQKKLTFSYEQTENKSFQLTVEPYRLQFTNRGYYLIANYLGKEKKLKTYSIDKMSNIIEGDSFKIDFTILEMIERESKYYGIKKENTPIKLELKYKDKTDEPIISKYFENKVVFEEEKICTIETIDLYECFYPIFSLGKKVEILDKDIQEKYKKFLQDKLKELR